MKDDPTKQAVRQIQSIITKDRGSPLSADAEAALTRVIETIGADHHLQVLPIEQREVTILLADLRGFTSISAAHPAAVVIGVLNRCLAAMSEVVFLHQGTIDKFMGDSIMVLFGAPHTRGDDVQRALTCAVQMQVAMARLNEMFRAEGQPELFLGIGINTGGVMAGNFGSEAYSEYTVIGNEVNLASRIEAFTVRGQVLISESTYARAGAFAETGPPMDVHVKGKDGLVTLRELLAIPSLGLVTPRQDPRRSRRVNATIACNVQRIENKIVFPNMIDAMILDIGYHGVLMQAAEDLPMHTDLKLDFHLGLVDYRVTDVYAKVVKRQPFEGRTRYGVEFTAIKPEATQKIQLFVQLLVGGH